MSKYYEIRADEMEQLLRGLGFVEMKLPGVFEMVFVKPVTDDLEIRVFTSIKKFGSGTARGVGEDAIRVVIFSSRHNRAVGSERRVYRVVGWAKNLGKRISDVLAQLRELPRCPKCNDLMVERSGPFGKFMGCLSYPACKGTRSIAA